MELIDFARRSLEVPYVPAGHGWQGWDCWGLVVCLFETVHGIALPLFGSISESELDLSFECAKYSVEIPLGREQASDVVIFRGDPLHTGVVLHRGAMLHCLENFGTKVDSYRRAIWRQSVIGIYRHAGLSAS